MSTKRRFHYLFLMSHAFTQPLEMGTVTLPFSFKLYWTKYQIPLHCTGFLAWAFHQTGCMKNIIIIGNKWKLHAKSMVDVSFQHSSRTHVREQSVKFGWQISLGTIHSHYSTPTFLFYGRKALLIPPCIAFPNAVAAFAHFLHLSRWFEQSIMINTKPNTPLTCLKS